MRDHWLGVELRHLAAISAIAGAGSFRGAAQQLGYAQSAISQQVAFLERHCGVRLVERSRGSGRVSLTEAGKVLCAHAEPMISRLRAARADIDAFADGRTDQVRVGVDPSVGRHILPLVLGDLAERPHAPGIHLIETSGDGHRRDLIERGELDLAFVDLPVSPGPLATRELLRDRFLLLVPAGSPLAGLGRAPTMAETLTMPVIGVPAARLTPEGARVRGAMPCLTLQALVAAGQGVAIVPELAVDRREPGVVALELADPPPPRILGIAWHAERHLSVAVLSFLAAAERHCAPHVEPEGEVERPLVAEHGA